MGAILLLSASWLHGLRSAAKQLWRAAHRRRCVHKRQVLATAAAAAAACHVALEVHLQRRVLIISVLAVSTSVRVCQPSEFTAHACARPAQLHASLWPGAQRGAAPSQTCCKAWCTRCLDLSQPSCKMVTEPAWWCSSVSQPASLLSSEGTSLWPSAMCVFAAAMLCFSCFASLHCLGTACHTDVTS